MFALLAWGGGWRWAPAPTANPIAQGVVTRISLVTPTTPSMSATSSNAASLSN